ncbi:hypothetical protein JJJ17_13925 [Paracoccus caeni]|uniref:Uncharacterized protein n=1 Tax=Paracoccus caeni TaxID=657651 RepID=A0A934SGJ2_9RHOB|nr:hypothetical protein [Paracoccus caeni]MBK4217030.1 hypothetical protein [Paracoccus caeni]
MTTYVYRASRRTDGADILSDTIEDLRNIGFEMLAETVRSVLIHTHPLARDLAHHDIEVELWLAPSSRADAT